MNIPKHLEPAWRKYNELRSDGLKKQANQALLSIVETIERHGPEKYKHFLFELCEQGLSHDANRRNIQHPLFVRCILPMLVKGYESNSVTELIHLVRGNLCGFGKEIYTAIGDISNEVLLKTVLSIDPAHSQAIELLAQDYVHALDFGAHHLPDALVVDWTYAEGVIQESSQFFGEHADSIDQALIESHQYYLQLYSDYQTWKDGEYSFNFQTWCEKNGRTYHQVKAYYYR